MENAGSQTQTRAKKMMLKILLTIFLALLYYVQGETPPEFEPSTRNRLGVTFREQLQVQPGAKISKDDTESEPRLDLRTLEHASRIRKRHRTKYMVLMIDLDVPHNDATFPFLHWYQPDLVVANKLNCTLDVLHSSRSSKAEYIAPSPPLGPAHRYVELLFEQPDHYSIPREFERYLPKKSQARLGFDVKEFVKAAQLDDLLAANWFLVQTEREEL